MILTKYIFKHTINNVCISTIVFLGVIWLTQSFKTIKLIINKGASLSDFFILSAYSLPNWLLIALPFGTFAGCMISYLKFENDREIVVMKAAGLSSLKISKPAILVALLSSIILFILSHLILPITYKNFKSLQNNIRNNSKDFIIKDNLFLDMNEDQTIFIGQLDNNNSFQEIFIQDRSDKVKLVELYSRSGYLIIKQNKIILFMNKGTRFSTKGTQEPTILDFNNYKLEINKNESKPNPTRVIEYNEYSFFDLIKKADQNKSNKGKLLAEAHSRNTVVLLPIVFVLIVMITILNNNYLRIASTYKKTIGISILIIIQSLFILMKNAVHSNVILLPFMYFFPLIIISIGFVIIHKNIDFKKLFNPNFKKLDL
ncbi:LptF/LptG family permease [Alphaproteobacteria bacterium]|nr:LptF/LptG family permease [Alphaproteobacteria bacterium]